MRLNIEKEIEREKGSNLSETSNSKKTRDKRYNHYKRLFFGMNLVVVLLFAGICVASATEYYVATTGNNEGAGLSPETAWATIQYAVGSYSPVSAGDTIYVLDGFYSEWEISFAKDDITLTAYNQTSPNVVIEAPPDERIIKVYYRNNINISKVETSGGGYGISVYFSNNIHISECVIHNTNGNGIEIAEDSHYCSIDGCEIYSCYYNLMQLGGRSTNGGLLSTHISITNCKIHDGIHHGLIDVGGDVDYLDIINNEMWLGVWGSGPYTHMGVNGGYYWNVKNNHIWDSVDGLYFSGGAVHDSVIEGNTFEDISSDFSPIPMSEQSPIQILSNCNNLTFKNNAYVDIVSPLDVRVMGSDYLFDGDRARSYRIDNGGGTIRNALSPTNSFTVQSRNGAVITVEFTDGRTFSVDGSGEYASYTITSWTHAIEVTGEDTTPPIASNGQPFGTTGGNTPTLSVASNEPATCKGNIDTDETYENMDFTFTGTDTAHSYDVTTSLSDGGHIVYVWCKDTAGNIATSSYSWSFTVDTTSPIININEIIFAVGGVVALWLIFVWWTKDTPKPKKRGRKR